MPKVAPTPIESRCHAALQAFQKQRGRLPTHRELAEAAGLDAKGKVSDVLHRLVCKGWLETDKLPAPPIEPKSKRTPKPISLSAPRKRRRVAKPSAPKFVPRPTEERVSVALLRAIRDRLATGMTKHALRRECGVQHGQLQQLLANGTSLRTPAFDRLCEYLNLQLLAVAGDRTACAEMAPTESLRKAIADERSAGASLREICVSATVSESNISDFTLGKCSLNLKTVDALCGVLGLGLRSSPSNARPRSVSARRSAERADPATSETSRNPRNARVRGRRAR